MTSKKPGTPDTHDDGAARDGAADPAGERKPGSISDAAWAAIQAATEWERQRDGLPFERLRPVGSPPAEDEAS